MPRDIGPRSVIARLGTLSRLAYTAHTNHLIAISRTVCAFALLLLASTDTVVPGLHRDFGDVFALAFAGFAIVTLIVSFQSWYLDFTLSETFIILDTAAFFILIAPRATMAAGFAASALCLIAHILFSSSMRWRWGFGILMAVLLNTLWIADITLFELPHANLDQGGALRWSLFAVLESVVVIWASAQIPGATVPRFTGDVSRPGLPLTISAIGYATRTASASDAILCWIDRDDLGCYMCSAGALDDELPPTRLSFGAADAFRKLAPMVFDTARDRAIISADAKLPARGAPVPGYALLRELGVEQGLCIPVDSDEGRSWLILTGIPMLGWGHLQLARAICSEVTQGMIWQIGSANALDSALSRLRRTVACDLHDSVAHSLAGAKFLLVALRSKVTPDSDVAREIDSIKEALDAEHLQVRKLIEQLRQANSDSRVRNLIEDLEAIRPTLASRWQIAVELIDTDFRVDVPVWLSLEIQQIVREAISNGVRHGRASKIAIKCQRRSGAIEIEVTDNGCGFANPHTPALPRSISERLGELGGSLEVTSSPESTTLRASIPSGAAG